MLRFAPVSLVLLASIVASPVEAEDPISIQSDDMIVWVGNTFVERAQSYGHIETAILLGAGTKFTGVKFRNLGWSGDSITNESRAYFGPPKEGQERLVKGISELKPHILLLTYGTVEAMEGADEAQLRAFREGLTRIAKDLKKAAGPQLREIVFVTPPPFENLGGLLPDQSENNASLARYVEATTTVADATGGKVVNIFGAMNGPNFDGNVTETPLTENGVHYTEAGYREIAPDMALAFGLAPLQHAELALKDIEELRQLIIAKNRLFFHRWRPANETYLFLFRKHEQGQNAKEIPMFDPLVAEQEAKIETARAAIFEKVTPR